MKNQDANNYPAYSALSDDLVSYLEEKGRISIVQHRHLNAGTNNTKYVLTYKENGKDEEKTGILIIEESPDVNKTEGKTVEESRMVPAYAAYMNNVMGKPGEKDHPYAGKLVWADKGKLENPAYDPYPDAEKDVFGNPVNATIASLRTFNGETHVEWEFPVKDKPEERVTKVVWLQDYVTGPDVDYQSGRIEPQEAAYVAGRALGLLHRKGKGFYDQYGDQLKDPFRHEELKISGSESEWLKNIEEAGEDLATVIAAHKKSEKTMDEDEAKGLLARMKENVEYLGEKWSQYMTQTGVDAVLTAVHGDYFHDNTRHNQYDGAETSFSQQEGNFITLGELAAHLQEKGTPNAEAALNKTQHSFDLGGIGKSLAILDVANAVNAFAPVKNKESDQDGWTQSRETERQFLIGYAEVTGAMPKEFLENFYFARAAAAMYIANMRLQKGNREVESIVEEASSLRHLVEGKEVATEDKQPASMENVIKLIEAAARRGSSLFPGK